MLSLELRLFCIGFSLLFNIIIVLMLKKGHIDLRYSLLWLLAGVVMLVISIFPGIVYWFSGLIGIKAPLNTVFMLAIFFLVIMVIMLTTIVSGLKEKIVRLTQVTAILEKRIADLEEKLKSKEQ